MPCVLGGREGGCAHSPSAQVGWERARGHRSERPGRRPSRYRSASLRRVLAWDELIAVARVWTRYSRRPHWDEILSMLFATLSGGRAEAGGRPL
eukprot:scaffold64787_cov66-Phaeocystis_antarctica.AAC.1